MTQHLPILSIIVLFLGAFLTAIFGSKNKYLRIIIVTLATSISFVFVMLLIKPVLTEGNIITYWIGDWVPEMENSIGIGLEVDGLNLFFGMLASISILISVIFSFKYIVRDRGKDKYYILFLMLSGSILGVLFTGDFFNMFLMMTLMTFAAVGLTTFRNNSYGEYRAAFKLLIVNSLALAFILIGIIMLYAQFHTLNMVEITARLHNNYTPVTLFALAVLLGGFGVKAFLVPSHNILSDVSHGAPIPISMLFSGIINLTGVYGIIRIVFVIYTSMNIAEMKLMFVIWGIVTMLIGTIMAFVQEDLKRFLAYSSISQIGYIFIGIGLSTVYGLTGGLYHILNQVLFMGILFLCAGGIEYTTSTTDLSKLGGISKKMPITALIFIIGALSIVGLPPFNGFASKFIIYQGAFKSGHAPLGIILIITSILTLTSFIKVFKSVFLGELPGEYENITETPLSMKIPIWAMVILSIIAGNIPQFIIKHIITPAVSGILYVGKYIDTMMGAGYAEKWFGEPLAAPLIYYTFPDSLRIFSLILLIVLMVFVLSALIGAINIKTFGEAYNSIGGSVLSKGKESGSMASLIVKLYVKFKDILRWLSDFLGRVQRNLESDYSLWVVSTTAILLVYLFIFV